MRFFGKKAILALGLVSFGFILFLTAKEFYKKKEIQTEINKLQQEADRISRENSTIQAKIAYLDSQDYKEREAKDKLGLQDPNENVVVVKPGIPQAAASIEQAQTIPPQQPEKKSIPAKWWNYFFKL